MRSLQPLIKLEDSKKAINQLNELSNFIPNHQLSLLEKLCQPDSEECEHFQNKVNELHSLIKKMPQTYETEGQKDPLCHLHYFGGSYDAFIIEKDKGYSGGTVEIQMQAFGLASFGCPELGMISIQELKKQGSIELDLYWEPKPLSKVKESLSNN